LEAGSGNGSDAENERMVAHKLWGIILQPLHFAARNLHF